MAQLLWLTFVASDITSAMAGDPVDYNFASADESCERIYCRICG